MHNNIHECRVRRHSTANLLVDHGFDVLLQSWKRQSSKQRISFKAQDGLEIDSMHSKYVCYFVILCINQYLRLSSTIHTSVLNFLQKNITVSLIFKHSYGIFYLFRVATIRSL